MPRVGDFKLMIPRYAAHAGERVSLGAGLAGLETEAQRGRITLKSPGQHRPTPVSPGRPGPRHTNLLRDVLLFRGNSGSVDIKSSREKPFFAAPLVIKANAGV